MKPAMCEILWYPFSQRSPAGIGIVSGSAADTEADRRGSLLHIQAHERWVTGLEGLENGQQVKGIICSDREQFIGLKVHPHVSFQIVHLEKGASQRESQYPFPEERRAPVKISIPKHCQVRGWPLSLYYMYIIIISVPVHSEQYSSYRMRQLAFLKTFQLTRRLP